MRGLLKRYLDVDRAWRDHLPGCSHRRGDRGFGSRPTCPPGTRPPLLRGTRSLRPPTLFVTNVTIVTVVLVILELHVCNCLGARSTGGRLNPSLVGKDRPHAKHPPVTAVDLTSGAMALRFGADAHQQSVRRSAGRAMSPLPPGCWAMPKARLVRRRGRRRATAMVRTGSATPTPPMSTTKSGNDEGCAPHVLVAAASDVGDGRCHVGSVRAAGRI